MRAPTTSGGTTFGPGTANNLLKSNGTSIYWTTLAASDIPTLSITDKTSGTLPVTRGGTGATTTAGARTNLEITPANIGAVAKTGDTMTGALTIDDANTTANQYAEIARFKRSATRNNDNVLLYLGKDFSTKNCGTILYHHVGDGSDSNYLALSAYNAPQSLRSYADGHIELTQPLGVASGGTGATTAAGARTNLGVNDIGTYEAQSAITPVNDNQVHDITISADCWVCVSLHVTANTDGSAFVWRNGIHIIHNEHTNGACNYWVNAQFPCKAGGLLQYMISSNATDSYISFLTV